MNFYFLQCLDILTMTNDCSTIQNVLKKARFIWIWIHDLKCKLYSECYFSLQLIWIIIIVKSSPFFFSLLLIEWFVLLWKRWSALTEWINCENNLQQPNENYYLIHKDKMSTLNSSMFYFSLSQIVKFYIELEIEADFVQRIDNLLKDVEDLSKVVTNLKKEKERMRIQLLVEKNDNLTLLKHIQVLKGRMESRQ